MKFQGNLLYVRELEESVRFYVKGLGLSVASRPAPHMAIVELGNGVIFLHEDPTDGPDTIMEALDREVRGVGVIPHIEVESVAALKAQLAGEGFETSSGPIEEHGAIRLYVYDPSGYNIVFVEPTGER